MLWDFVLSFKGNCWNSSNLMSSRFPSHKLSNGLYVSGRPEQQPKERPPTMSSTSMPYTGGDIKKSGELGKMFDISMDGSRPRKSGPINSAPSRSGSFGGATSHLSQLTPNSLNRMGSLSSVPNSASLKITSSGPLNKHGEPLTRASGPQGGGTNFVSRQNSGPLPPVLPATGLITSGPIISGPLNATGGPRTKASGPLDSSGSLKPNSSVLQNHTVTRLSQENEYSFFKNFPKLIFWSIILLFAVGFLAGTFIFAAVGNPILFAVVIVLFVAVTSVFVWNSCWGTRAITSFISQYPDCDLKTATSGQFIKVSGVCDIFFLSSQLGLLQGCNVVIQLIEVTLQLFII